MTSEIEQEIQNKRSYKQEQIINHIKNDVESIRTEQVGKFNVLTFDDKSEDEFVDSIISKISELEEENE